MGFAIGRSIWEEPIADHIGGKVGEEETTDRIAGRDLGFARQYCAACDKAQRKDLRWESSATAAASQRAGAPR